MSCGYWSSGLSDICKAARIAFELVDTSGVGILIFV